MSSAADHFHLDMVTTVDQLKNQIHYSAQRFAQMLHELGGVGAAQRLLLGPSTSDGFTKLWEHGLLPLSVEAHVLLPWYSDLFTPEERANARYRLEAHGFDVEVFLESARSPAWASGMEPPIGEPGPSSLAEPSVDELDLTLQPPPTVHSSTKDPSPGLQAAEELDAMNLEELAGYLRRYEQATAYDVSVSRLKKKTSGPADLTNPEHRDALIEWLRQWGCRHLAKADHARTSEALSAWYSEFQVALPEQTTSLLDLTRDELTQSAIAFDQLSQWPAASRRRAKGLSEVRVGPTAAAKTLWAIRPNAFAPWDEPIRDALGFSFNDSAYRSYMEQVARHLRGFIERFSVSLDDLPQAVGRPDSSAPKLVDEYYWARITRNLSP
jgi:hypothetical protein